MPYNKFILVQIMMFKRRTDRTFSMFHTFKLVFLSVIVIISLMLNIDFDFNKILLCIIDIF